MTAALSKRKARQPSESAFRTRQLPVSLVLALAGAQALLLAALTLDCLAFRDEFAAACCFLLCLFAYFNFFSPFLLFLSLGVYFGRFALLPIFFLLILRLLLFISALAATSPSSSLSFCEQQKMIERGSKDDVRGVHRKPGWSTRGRGLF